MPTWDLLSELFSSVDGVSVVKFNCQADKLFCTEYDIGGYPSLRLYTHGIYIPEAGEKYSDLPHLDGLVEWLSRKVNIVAPELPPIDDEIKNMATRGDTFASEDGYEL